MIDTKACLIEIGTEELPPKALLKLSEAFTAGIVAGLQQAHLSFGEVESFATPRRLAVRIKALESEQAPMQIERRGPAVSAAFTASGEPTPAAMGFARSCQTTVDHLERLQTPQGEWLNYRAIQPGQSINQLLPEIVSQSLDKLPIPKRMRWGNRSVEFVRPVHWVVLLYGSTIIDAAILSIPAGNQTWGHRFHHPEPITLPSSQDYETLLESQGQVIPSFARRRELIREQVIEQARRMGGTAVISDALLDEVTGLVEYPVALWGSFDERFLAVPKEALMSSMQDHQRYFPVIAADESLLPGFIAVANIQSTEPAMVRAGNERVIRPRLADAAFFWDQDRKAPLSSRQEGLKNLVFQDKLGSIFAKSTRMAQLAERIGTAAGWSVADVKSAALLAKCDLLTAMVGEFPELQGVMGGYYARHDGEPEAVAQAINEHYRPRFAGDELPVSETGSLVAIADKLDTLTAIFSLGLIPTGDKDPFALRRNALGIIRIIIEKKLVLGLSDMIGFAVDALAFGGDRAALIDQVRTFILDRLRAYYLDQGVVAEVYAAVRAVDCDDLRDFDARVNACKSFLMMADAEALSAANKRVRNILRKAEDRSDDAVAVIEHHLVEPAEQQLYRRLGEVSATVCRLTATGQDYSAALSLLAQLREPLDLFFDQVMVMAEDPQIRQNRLALLAEVSGLFMRIADVSRLFA